MPDKVQSDKYLWTRVQIVILKRGEDSDDNDIDPKPLAADTEED